MMGAGQRAARALLAEARGEITAARERRRSDPSLTLGQPQGGVLVVDDDADFADLVCSYVRMAGLPVIHVAHSLKAAFSALTASPISGAICDHSLPDGTSSVLVETLRKVPVETLVLSGTLPPEQFMVDGVPRLVKGVHNEQLRYWLSRLAAGETGIDPFAQRRSGYERRSSGTGFEPDRRVVPFKPLGQE